MGSTTFSLAELQVGEEEEEIAVVEGQTEEDEDTVKGDAEEKEDGGKNTSGYSF